MNIMDPSSIPEDYRLYGLNPYNPMADRNVIRDIYPTINTNRAIRAGEELLDNYLSFGGESDFKDNVLELREDCSGGLGTVEQYQTNITAAVHQQAQVVRGGEAVAKPDWMTTAPYPRPIGSFLNPK
jgi:hypothetical protein